LCDGLVEAVRRESGVAVAHWWGVSSDVVRKWRRALGVGVVNEGGSLLRQVASGETRRGKRHTEAGRQKVREALCQCYGLPLAAVRP
jgi:hypothetical protein